MLVADCCRHGLLLWIIEDWPRWAFPSGTYYIRYCSIFTGCGRVSFIIRIVGYLLDVVVSFIIRIVRYSQDVVESHLLHVLFDIHRMWWSHLLCVLFDIHRMWWFHLLYVLFDIHRMWSSLI